MSKRSCRKRKNQDVELSSSWYVGYAEDGESVEAIMKKFEELEKLQHEVSKTSQEDDTQDSDKNQELLNQSQLEELFKRTSAFTVQTATLSEDLDDLEIWKMMTHGDVQEEEEEEDDYQVWWDEPEKVKKERNSTRGVSRTVVDKGSLLLARYKSIQMQDRQGNFYFVKKKIPTVDPNLPTYIKIPHPIPRSWAKAIVPFEKQEDVPCCDYFETSNLLEFDFKSQLRKGFQFQAILMDPPFLLQDQNPLEFPKSITIQQFESLKIPSLISFGFLFIWTEKEFTLDVIRACEKWGFKYVENFAWIKMNMENKIAQEPGTFFNKSKTTCLIFRKEGEIELRHQRSPDCEFDFIKPSKEATRQAKPRFIYEVIETLLPQTQAPDRESPRLLQLWSEVKYKRSGWTLIHQI